MADGNEVLSIDQLKSMASTASVTSYGLAKVMTDEQLDAYLGAGSVADASFELTPIDSHISEFNMTGKCVDGVVTITGSASTGNSGQYQLEVATIPEQYRPLSNVTGSCQVVKFSYPWDEYDASIVARTDGTIFVSYYGDYSFKEVKNISISYSIGGNDSAEEPDGIYVVTVQQAVKYLGDMFGGGSGGGQ